LSVDPVDFEKLGFKQDSSFKFNCGEFIREEGEEEG